MYKTFHKMKSDKTNWNSETLPANASIGPTMKIMAGIAIAGGKVISSLSFMEKPVFFVLFIVEI